MGSGLSLGVLEFFPVWPDQGPSDVLQDSILHVQALEEIGYDRYWIAEHQSPRVAHCSPPILIALIAALTSRMCIGSGGILLAGHDPLQVARDFKLLNCLFPGRIDLGLARGGAKKDVSLSDVLNADRPVELYSEMVSTLLSSLRNGEDKRISPLYVEAPRIWMLGSGDTSAALAAEKGTHFCFAHFLAANPLATKSVISFYRQKFGERYRSEENRAAIAVAVICAESNEKAHESGGLTGGPIKIRNKIVGNPQICAQAIRELSESTGVTDFLILELSRTPQQRLQSYTLLAKALSLI